VIPLAVPLADEENVIPLVVEFPNAVVWILVGADTIEVGAEVSVPFAELVGGGTSVERVVLPVRTVVGKLLLEEVLEAPVPTKLLEDVVGKVKSDVTLPIALLPDPRMLEIKLTRFVLEEVVAAAPVLIVVELVVVRATPVEAAPLIPDVAARIDESTEVAAERTELRSEVTSLRMLLTPTKIPVDEAAELDVVEGAAVMPVPVPVPTPVYPETIVEVAAADVMSVLDDGAAEVIPVADVPTPVIPEIVVSTLEVPEAVERSDVVSLTALVSAIVDPVPEETTLEAVLEAASVPPVPVYVRPSVVVGTLTAEETSLSVLDVVLEPETIPLGPNVISLAVELVVEGELEIVELLERIGSKRLALLEAAAAVSSELTAEDVVVGRMMTPDPVPIADESTVLLVESAEVVVSVDSVDSTVLDVVGRMVVMALEPVPTALDPVPTAEDCTVLLVVEIAESVVVFRSADVANVETAESVDSVDPTEVGLDDSVTVVATVMLVVEFAALSAESTDVVCVELYVELPDESTTTVLITTRVVITFVELAALVPELAATDIKEVVLEAAAKLVVEEVVGTEIMLSDKLPVPVVSPFVSSLLLVSPISLVNDILFVSDLEVVDLGARVVRVEFVYIARFTSRGK
jgi:hypothetical protein